MTNPQFLTLACAECEAKCYVNRAICQGCQGKGTVEWVRRDIVLSALINATIEKNQDTDESNLREVPQAQSGKVLLPTEWKEQVSVNRQDVHFLSGGGDEGAQAQEG